MPHFPNDHTLLQELSDPVDITDWLLDRKRAALLDKDFDAFHACMRLPHHMGSFEGDRIIRTPEELQAVFQAMLEMMNNLGVIDMKRRAIEARYISGDRIEATTVTEYILGGFKVSDEVVGYSLITRAQDGWKVAETRYATKIDALSKALMRR